VHIFSVYKHLDRSALTVGLQILQAYFIEVRDIQ